MAKGSLKNREFFYEFLVFLGNQKDTRGALFCVKIPKF